MTANQQAIIEFESFYNIKNISKIQAIECAIIHVKGIIEVVKPDPYHRKKNKMDREYWK